MISKEKAYSDFITECRLHKEQQELYRVSLQNEGIYTTREPCCTRSFSDCFERYCKSLMRYSEGEKFDWCCAFNGNEVFYTKNKDEYIPIEEIREICKEFGIDLD